NQLLFFILPPFLLVFRALPIGLRSLPSSDAKESREMLLNIFIVSAQPGLQPWQCSSVPLSLYPSVPYPQTVPPRYLALDVGTNRIGIAVSDELGLTAQPVLTLEVRRNPRDDLRSMARLARKFSVAGIVVGNRLHPSA